MPARRASRRSRSPSPLASANLTSLSSRLPSSIPPLTRRTGLPRRRRVRFLPTRSDVVNKKMYPAESDLLKREEIRTRSLIADMFDGKQATREEIMEMWPEIKRKTGWKIDPCPVNAIRWWVEEGREALHKDAATRRGPAEPRGRAPAYYPWEETRAREIAASRDSSTDTIQPDRIRKRNVLFANSNANSNTSSYAIVDEEASAEPYNGQEEPVSDIVGTFLDRQW
jgi:hypothetical protein